MMKMKRRVLILALGLVMALGLGACRAEEAPSPVREVSISPDYVIAEGHILPIQTSWLNFAVQGRVAEILVEEGDQVARGQGLIRLDHDQAAQAGLKAAELELVQARQAYDDFLRTSDLAGAQAWQAFQAAQTLRGEAESEWEDLDLDYLEDRVDDARIEVRDREDELEDALEEWEKYQDVDEDNYARQAAEDDLEDAQEEYNQAQRDLEDALGEIDGPRAALDAALAAEAEALREYEMYAAEGFDLDQKILLETGLAAAEANLAVSREIVEDYTLTAPYAGTLTKINIDTGQFIGPEYRAAQLADLGEMIIETSDLTELEVVKIFPGQVVEIVPDALPDEMLLGKVESISQAFTTQAGDILYTVTISLEEQHPDLRWGMTVELTFLP